MIWESITKLLPTTLCTSNEHKLFSINYEIFFCISHNEIFFNRYHNFPGLIIFQYIFQSHVRFSCLLLLLLLSLDVSFVVVVVVVVVSRFCWEGNQWNWWACTDCCTRKNPHILSIRPKPKDEKIAH